MEFNWKAIEKKRAIKTKTNKFTQVLTSRGAQAMKSFSKTIEILAMNNEKKIASANGLEVVRPDRRPAAGFACGGPHGVFR